MQDLLHRYIFENLDARGELVQLNTTFNEIIQGHNYPDPVKHLLGELLFTNYRVTRRHCIACETTPIPD